MPIYPNSPLDPIHGLRMEIERISKDTKWLAAWELLAGAFGVSIAIALWCFVGDPSLPGAGLALILFLALHAAWLVLTYHHRTISLQQWNTLLSLGIQSQVGYVELNNYLKNTGVIHVYQLETVFKERGSAWHTITET